MTEETWAEFVGAPGGDPLFVRPHHVRAVTIARPAQPTASVPQTVLLLMVEGLNPLAVMDTTEARQQLGLPIVQRALGPLPKRPS